MAEPFNTPAGSAAPSRAPSPPPALPPMGALSLASSPTTPRRHTAQNLSRGSLWTTRRTHYRPGMFSSHPDHLVPPIYRSTKPTVLLLGDPVIKYNPEAHAEFSALVDVVCPSIGDRIRSSFVTALKEKKWGDFAAVFRSSSSSDSGLEMGKWDCDIIELLPKSLCIVANAGAGVPWADTEFLASLGITICDSAMESVGTTPNRKEIAAQAEELCMRNIINVLCDREPVSSINLSLLHKTPIKGDTSKRDSSETH
ncbi:hypothetical protein F5Y16DRAFT_184968 [Xylariaceae sp. FL0255]|nr:hypothetical protein F5Y16DRAFT_184968 [Xylariaceae sp. FL0255]